MKEEEAISLSKQCNFNVLRALPLKLEASGREYWRIINNQDESFILCYLDPKKGNHSKFISISNNLKDSNISCANVIYHNEDLGVTIQDDLGDRDLLSILNDDNKDDLLKNSLEILLQIQNSKLLKVESFSKEELIEQMNLFKDIFCKKFLNTEADASIDMLISETIDTLINHPWVNCHFDFERRNLVLNKDNDLTVIDYQDMKVGPIGIDLAAILVDHYYEANISHTKTLLNYYSNLMKLEYSEEELYEFLRWGCIQRNLRILGTLANLYIENNRSFRLKDLPMILNNLIEMVPDEHSSKEFMKKHIKSILDKKISEL